MSHQELLLAGRVARRRLLALFCTLTGALLLCGASALAAAPLPGHALGRSISPAEETRCSFEEAGPVAVNEATGEVYVYDRTTNSVDRFSSTGACIQKFKAGPSEEGEEGAEGIAVDSSPTSPSFGDVYVVDPNFGEPAVFKKTDDGKPISKIHAFKKQRTLAEKEAGEEPELHELEEVHGIAVDAKGILWVDYSFGNIASFPNTGAPAKETLSFSESGAEPAAGECGELKSGFAVGPNDEAFYVGRGLERFGLEGCAEPEATVISKFAPSVPNDEEEPVIKELDEQNTTGVAVDSSTGEVYLDNGTTVAAFGTDGSFLQRFGGAAEEGAAHLKSGRGIAVDSATNEVFVVDAAEGSVKVFVPSAGAGNPPPAAPVHELPDGRAWELVSPSNKHGAGINPISLISGVEEASEDGSAIAYTATAPIVADPPANRSPEFPTVVSRRGTEAWSAEDVATPRGPVPQGYASSDGTEYRIFSPDLSAALLQPDLGVKLTHEPPLSPEATETTLYKRNLTLTNAACEASPAVCYQPLVSASNVPPGTEFGAKLELINSTPDLKHVVLESEVGLLSGLGAGDLYEWEPGAPLQLINVLPSEEGTVAGGATLGAGEKGGSSRNAITDEGSRVRVVWHSEPDSEESLEGKQEHLYIRDMTKGETLRIDQPQAGTPPAVEDFPNAAVFQTASSDGSKIFFTDNHKLTPESGEEQGETSDGDLYVCEMVEVAGKLACDLTDLTTEGPGAERDAAVQGVVPGASENGSTIYFVANGALAGNTTRGRCDNGQDTEATDLRCNLYVEHGEAGNWGKPTFIATLSSEDHPDWETIEEQTKPLSGLTSRVSPNGRYFAFMSELPLTGYDNTDKNSHQPDEEVFRYDAKENSILCASCNPSGEPPAGVHDIENSGEGKGLLADRSEIWKEQLHPSAAPEDHWLAGSIPGWTPQEKERALYQSRYLSDSGRLFFNSPDALVEADKNNREDVYEFEPGGEGGCASATGCVALISSGASEQESAFLDASKTGDDVFFLTSQQLVKQDPDNAFDIYDAHVCSSSAPCLGPPAEPPTPCMGEECKPASSSQAALPSVPASATSSGGSTSSQQVLATTVVKKAANKPLTRAQKLAKALKSCKKLKKKTKRQACEKQARKKYGAKAKKGKSSHSSKKGKR